MVVHMKTSDFDYFLPEELIAQSPVEPRDHSRLLVYDRRTKIASDEHFYDIINYLHPGDALVLNQTKVLPARLYGRKKDSGAKCEVLLLERLNADIWEGLLRPAKRIKEGGIIEFTPDFTAELLKRKEDGVCEVKFTYSGLFEHALEKNGTMPLPPYIKQTLQDQRRYQTVYAHTPGSAAAPTAGLHFTPELIERIERKGIEIVKILLHVGLGTFRPVKTEDIASHVMHSEHYEITQQAADRINRVKRRGNRVIAVGTTSVRTLESAQKKGIVEAGKGETDIFIYPSFQFRITDALITNFHLPKSTLLMLVSAFIGREETLKLYKKAVEDQYRFFSFGDAMLLL